MPAKQQPQQKSIRWAAALMAAIPAAALLILLVVWMTPLDDESLDSNGGETALGATAVPGEFATGATGSPSADGSLATSPQPDVSATASAPALTPQASLPSGEDELDLPTDLESFEVESLQDELRSLAVELVEKFPEDAGSWHLAGQTFSELKQSEKAEEFWRKSIELSPRYLGPYLGFASMLAEKGQDAEALDVLKQAYDLGARAPDLSQQMAECYENLGQIDEALQVVDEGLAESPDDDQLLLVHGRLKTQTGDFEAAEQSLQKIIALRGKSEAVLVALTNVYVRQGRRDEAKQTRADIQGLAKPTDIDEDRFQDNYESALRGIASGLFVSAGSLWAKHEDLVQAEKNFLRGVSLNPTNKFAYQGLQSLLTRQQRYGSLRPVLERLAELDPKNLVHWVNLASACMQLRDGAGAEKALKKAESLDPGGILAQTSLAKIYLVLNRFEEARKYASLVVERNPSRATYQLLAATHEACGDITAAQASLAKGQEFVDAVK